VTADGHRLTVTVRGARADRVRIVVRHKKKVVARRTARTHRGRAKVGIKLPRRVEGTVRVVVLDPRPPPRTARAQKRLPED
jgi:hypothetical protein